MRRYVEASLLVKHALDAPDLPNALGASGHVTKTEVGAFIGVTSSSYALCFPESAGPHSATGKARH